MLPGGGGTFLYSETPTSRTFYTQEKRRKYLGALLFRQFWEYDNKLLLFIDLFTFFNFKMRLFFRSGLLILHSLSMNYLLCSESVVVLLCCVVDFPQLAGKFPAPEKLVDKKQTCGMMKMFLLLLIFAKSQPGSILWRGHFL